MARPVTLFTGQWADLPLAELAATVERWGFDGVELACWGDHFEVDRARRRAGLREGAAGPARAPRARLLGDRRAPRRPGRRDPIDARHQGILPPEVWGDGDPEGVRQRAAERMKDTARAAAAFGVDGRQRLHRLAGLAHALLVPAERLRRDRARLRGVRRALGADHRRLRRGGREVRARGAPDRDRLRLRDDAQGARRDRQPARLRDQPRPEPLRAPVPRHGGVRDRVRRPDLPRPRQGLAALPRRPQLDPRRPPELRRAAARLGLRLARPRRRRLRGVLPGAEPDRLRGAALDRVGGLGHGPRLGRAGRARVRAPHRLRAVATSPSTRRCSARGPDRRPTPA